jgi:hypothetical protein
MLTSAGGTTAAGFQGEYFDNTTLSGSPTFTRRDVRIDFDWGTTMAPGGSLSPGFDTIGHDDFSAEWTGSVIPAYSQTYTFTAISDDGVRLYIRPTGSGSWTTLIDDWTSHSVATDTATYVMTAGDSYDLKVEYYQNTGEAEMRLLWQSPSMPEQVIDPIVQTGFNNPFDNTTPFTNIVEAARNSWNGFTFYSPFYDAIPAPSTDANGWPMGDGSYVFQESLNEGLGVDPLMLGTVTFSFNGKARISLFGNVNLSSLTYSYSTSTNTTSGSFEMEDLGINASDFEFASSTRTGLPGGPGGITNLKLMLPTAPNSAQSYSTTDAPIFTPQMETALENFTFLRFQLVGSQEQDWTDRTLPTYFNQENGSGTAPHNGVGSVANNGPSWEYKIMLANETGSDLMLSIPVGATDDYVTKLAELLKYGSDANGNPYTQPTTNPVYPPLNPNLHVYLELENELWNFAGAFSTDYGNLSALTTDHANADDADFAAFNCDNLSTAMSGGSYVNLTTWRLRYALLRMTQISGDFRNVWGSGAMMTDIRPDFEWQYGNTNNTASGPLAWADTCLNNADGQEHTTTPEPIDYYLYGGGGATYYGAQNGDGTTTLITDPNFNNVTFSNGYNLEPSGTMFTFASTSGIARYTGSGDIPPAYAGSQMGYITDKGSITFSVTFPSSQTSDVYALDFKALDRVQVGTTTADLENLRVYEDGTSTADDITQNTYSQGNGYTPKSYAQESNTWNATNVSWVSSDFYFTKLFDITPGSTHTFTIQGMGDIQNASTTNQTAFIGDVEVTSVDSIFNAGIPGGGEANGQPVNSNYVSTLTAEADWARAYGLQEVSYEGGWSLGGDDGGSPLQNYAKYGDSRTAAAQEAAMNDFYDAGSTVDALGTYEQWPNWSDT